MKIQVELIDRKAAIEAYNRLEPIAYSIAEAQGLMPYECTAPECLRLKALGSCLGLARHERALAVEGMPLYQTTSFEVAEGVFALGNICLNANHFAEAYIEGGRLTIAFSDGVQEAYEYLEKIDAYTFVRNNTAGIKTMFHHQN